MQSGRGAKRQLVMITAALVATVLVVGAGTARAASPADLDPNATPSLGVFNPTPGNYTIDTTTLTLNGPGGTAFGVDVNGAAVFDFDSITIGPAVIIQVLGTRPVALLSRSTFLLDGTIASAGGNAVYDSTTAAPGGAGGGAGGTAGVAGSGPGGGGPGTETSGGGGGGFGGAGADGATIPPGVGGPGGPVYGNLATLLQGGSGGGSGTGLAQTNARPPVGGGGGGAVALGANGALTINGSVDVSGGFGIGGGYGGSGGGSGGGILLQAPAVAVNGALVAKGGDGGGGGSYGDGGGGGGGRIHIIHAGLQTGNDAVISVAGGTSGFIYPWGPGVASPDQTGQAGVYSTGTYVPPTDPPGGTEPVCVRAGTDWRAPYANGSCPSGYVLHDVVTDDTGLLVCTKVKTDWRAPDANGCPAGFESHHVVTAESGLPVCVRPDVDWRAPYANGTCPSGYTKHFVVTAT